MNLLGYRLEKRLEANTFVQFMSVLAALLIATIISAILINSAGADVGEAFRAMVRGSVGSRSAITETIVQATPLIFTGLAVTVAFRGRLWNIGAEGQFFAGAMAAYWTASTFSNLPRIPMGVVIFLAAMIAGAVWGAIPALLKVRFGANEVIVTVMLNFVIQLYPFLPSERTLAGSWIIVPADEQDSRCSHLLPADHRTRIHLGMFIAVATVAVVWFLLWKTTLGYEIRHLGSTHWQQIIKVSLNCEPSC